MPLLSLTQLATDSAKYLGFLDAGATMSSSQLDDALIAANDMLDNWSSEEIMVPAVSLETFTLTAGVQSYTIGTGLTFNTTRPMAIEGAVHKNTMNAAPYDTPIKIVNASEWAGIDNRGQSNQLIDYLFYDRAQTSAKVYVSPIPLGGNIELTLWKALTQFADKTTQITVPFGYTLPMKLKLAMILAPMYDIAPTDAMVKNYLDSMATIRDLNAALMGRKPPAGQSDAATTPPSVIQTQ
jgi:hypothetical protein